MDDEVILPADKGNATVVMNKEDYDTKIRGMLETSTYRQLQRDPTATQENRLSNKLKVLEKCGEIPGHLYHVLRPSGSQYPWIYGLPKIYKPDVPLRPIVSRIRSLSYQLSKHIASIMTPLTGQAESYIQNSRHFVEMMKDVHLAEDEVLVSFDVVSLFTNVPIGATLQVIQERLTEDESLGDRTPLSAGRVAELLEVCLKSTYFQLRGRFL